MTGYSNSPKILKGGIVLIDAESGRVLRIISLGSMCGINGVRLD